MLALLRVLLLVAASLLPIVAGATPAAAQTPASVSWTRFDVDLAIQPNGDLLVTEVQQLRFDQSRQQGFRSIPLDRVEAIDDLHVSEPDRSYSPGSGQPYTYRVTRQDDAVRVDWWFPPTTGERTFLISYRVRGVIRVYEGGDQLRWQAVYADRAGPVQRSRVTVRFPADLTAGQVMLAGYPEGEVDSAALADPRTAVIEATSLAPGVGLEARVQFPHGLVAASPPAWQAQADREDWWRENARPVANFFALLASVAVLAGGLVFVLVTWAGRGRDPAVLAQVPRELTEPPSDLPPALVGTLVDEQADVQDVVATLVDLANRGVLKITEERDPSLVGSDLDYRFELVGDTTGLRDFERTMLQALLGGRREARLSAMQDRLDVPLVRDQLYREVARAGFFVDDPEQTRRRYRARAWTAIALGVIGSIVALAVLASLAELVFVPFLALVLVGLAALWAAGHMPQRTRSGAIEAARWRAFGRYLDRVDHLTNVEAHRSEFERYLPYAVALGIDRSWVARFASVGAPPPRWYERRPPIIIAGPGPWPVPGPGWEFPGPVVGPGPRRRRGARPADGEPGRAPGPDELSDRAAGGLQGGSDWLVDLLNRTSEVLSHGGGSGWSGGGAGGRGGGSGGGSGGFG